jgi:hypothetical protein
MSNGQINPKCVHKSIKVNYYKTELAKCVSGNRNPAFIEMKTLFLMLTLI